MMVLKASIITYREMRSSAESLVKNGIEVIFTLESYLLRVISDLVVLCCYVESVIEVGWYRG